ncbi:MAG TPA: CinA family nicotinamide mononucleotide deamidase-related protein [Anaerolineaceae bacterium]|nr:CinA family nicotinamide mononucleotide deamidase-related protein [Anaerolineaceae bacterium]
MPVVEIIAIGTELLLGEIQDTNTRYLARSFRNAGLDLFRASMVGDNATRIAQTIQEALQRADIVLTTGGLGPTVDDPTRQAVAIALGVDLEYRPELWEQIQERFNRYGRTPSENNKRQAYIPQGAAEVENPVGTAPAFIFDTGKQVVISLPGVPREMEYLVENYVLPFLRRRFQIAGTIQARVLHTAAVGESVVDELVADLEEQANPTVGLAAHPGQVDIRVTAKAASMQEARDLINETVEIIRARLDGLIFGEDEETLEGVTLKALATRGLELVTVEAGVGGRLLQRLAQAEGPFVGGEVLPDATRVEEVKNRLNGFMQARQARIGLGIHLEADGTRQHLHLTLITPGGMLEEQRFYGGAPGNATIWATNNGMDFVRRTMKAE